MYIYNPPYFVTLLEIMYWTLCSNFPITSQHFIYSLNNVRKKHSVEKLRKHHILLFGLLTAINSNNVTFDNQPTTAQQQQQQQQRLKLKQ